MEKTSDLIWQDKQHQVLFDLIDQITSNVVDDTVFRRLYDYAENHFAVEEEYMKQLEYPDIARHIKAHDRFRSELDDMMLSCHQYDENFCIALAEFLRRWLKSHIFGIDKELEDFIQKSNYK
jgi:hemerythrin